MSGRSCPHLLVSLLNLLRRCLASSRTNKVSRARGKVQPQRRPAVSLCLEVLEDRTVPSVLGTAQFATGERPQSVAVGDFNGDGKRDLVVANYGSGNVSVLRGNGRGGFKAPQSFQVGPGGISALAVADFSQLDNLGDER